ncbi:MAG: hypothetical protein GSR80_000876 [Desulfurococcales archaeon]|nr:hypothetical protein [Desulfurococcales archaeon]
MAPGGRLGKLVLLAGTSGVDVDAVLSLARELAESGVIPGRVGVVKFEDLITSRLLAHITSVLRYFIESRPSALEHFYEAYEALRSQVEGEGYDTLFLAAHLSYMVEGHLIPNPVLGRILGLAREATVIYYVEDYYDALDRIRRRSGDLQDLLASFNIDPITYLEWRGLDHNLLGLLSSMHDNVETIIFGVKHPRETHERLLAYAAQPRGRARRILHPAYFSHPITYYRRVYALQGASSSGASIGGLRGVRRLEEIKEELRRRIPSLVLFEPTTIDEILEDPPALVAEAAGCRDSCRGDLGSEPALTPLVTASNRWPLPPGVLHGDYAYASGGALNVVGEEFESLYGVDTLASLRESFCPRQCRGGPGGCPGVEASRLKRLIDLQVRIRDYEYVAQSSLLIAATIVYLARDGSGWRAYLVRSHGMEAELRRAQALGRPVYLLVDVIDLEDPGDPEVSLARGSGLLLECSLPYTSSPREARALAPQRCVHELGRAGPFTLNVNIVNLGLVPLKSFADALNSLVK